MILSKYHNWHLTFHCASSIMLLLLSLYEFYDGNKYWITFWCKISNLWPIWTKMLFESSENALIAKSVISKFIYLQVPLASFCCLTDIHDTHSFNFQRHCCSIDDKCLMHFLVFTWLMPVAYWRSLAFLVAHRRHFCDTFPSNNNNDNNVEFLYSAFHILHVPKRFNNYYRCL